MKMSRSIVYTSGASGDSDLDHCVYGVSEEKYWMKSWIDLGSELTAKA